MGFKIKFKNLLRAASAAGSSRYGGGAAEATPTTPPRVPLAPPPASPTSPSPLQAPRPPPRPAGKDTVSSSDLFAEISFVWRNLVLLDVLYVSASFLCTVRGGHVLLAVACRIGRAWC